MMTAGEIIRLTAFLRKWGGNMRTVWIVVMSGLRKNKGQTAGMLILMLLTAMFLNIGLSMYFGIENYYDERAEELNTPHFSTQEKEGIPNTPRFHFIESFPGVEEVETQSILHGIGALIMNGEQAATSVIIADGNAKQQMNPPHLVGRYKPLEGDAVYIPYGIYLSGGYSIGDTFELELAGTAMDFTVAGCTEEIFFGISPRIYISSAVFSQLQSQFEDNRFTLISARVEDGSAQSLSESYESAFANDENGGFLTISYPQVLTARVTNAASGALFIIVFSFIVLVVGVIAIRFCITNDMEENMTNIGVLKAAGCQNKQIILSIVLPYGIIAFAGGTAGVVLAQFILPMTGRILEPILGIPWKYKIGIVHMAASLILVLVIIIFFSLISSLRVDKLHPITALRGGKPDRHTRKNPMPLDKSHAPLSLAFTVKHLLLNKKQALMLTLIIAGLTFVSTFGLTVYYFVNSDGLRQSIMFEVIDISVELNDSAQGPAFRKRVQSLPQVTGIYGRDELKLDINGKQITTTIIEDFSSVDMNLVSGRFPLHDNEIIMGSGAMRVLGLSLGDWVSVKINGTDAMYLIVGTIQTQAERGMAAVLDWSGIRVIQPDFVFDAYAVVLTQEADGYSLADYLSSTESSIISDIFYTRPFIEVQLNVVKGIFANISIVLLLTAAVVVAMVLYMVIKTTILRERRQLGLQKALGFTSLQLMNQIALNLLPAAFIGAGMGTLGGILTFNPIYTAFLRDYGIVYSNIRIPHTWAAAIFLSLMMLTYAVSVFAAVGIRKITAYALITE